MKSTATPAASARTPATPDPYLWLEDVTGKKALEWVAQHDERSRKALAEGDAFKSMDAAFLTICASACSQFAWRRRMEAGYIDSLTTVPSQDVLLGTQMYGGSLYRQRGSVDQFASFQNMGVTPVMGLNGMIRQLLGIDRPQVA